MEDLFVVNKILGRRKTLNSVEYLVAWAGYGVDYNSWEPSKSLTEDCPSLVKRFEKQLNKARQKNRTRPSWTKKIRRADSSTPEIGKAKVGQSSAPGVIKTLERIVGRRIAGQNVEYEVTWGGLSTRHNSWISEETLKQDFKRLVAKYEARNPRESKVREKRTRQKRPRDEEVAEKGDRKYDENKDKDGDATVELKKVDSMLAQQKRNKRVIMPPKKYIPIDFSSSDEDGKGNGDDDKLEKVGSMLAQQKRNKRVIMPPKKYAPIDFSSDQDGKGNEEDDDLHNDKEQNEDEPNQLETKEQQDAENDEEKKEPVKVEQDEEDDMTDIDVIDQAHGTQQQDGEGEPVKVEQDEEDDMTDIDVIDQAHGTQQQDGEGDEEDLDNNPPPIITGIYHSSLSAGFTRGFEPLKILNVQEIRGQLLFDMAWKGIPESDSDLVPATEANLKCPDIVIQFYESKLRWVEEPRRAEQ